MNGEGIQLIDGIDHSRSLSSRGDGNEGAVSIKLPT